MQLYRIWLDTIPERIVPNPLQRAREYLRGWQRVQWLEEQDALRGIMWEYRRGASHSFYNFFALTELDVGLAMRLSYQGGSAFTPGHIEGGPLIETEKLILQPFDTNQVLA